MFDLFRTIVVFDDLAPTGRVHEATWRSAMGALRAPVRELLPHVDFDVLLDTIVAVADDISRAYPPEYNEIPSAERYQRALTRLGVGGPLLADTAERLSQLQMTQFLAHATVPESHATLLRELRQDYGIAMVSNFDHAPTIHALLARHGIDELFDATLISIEYGRRKPHPAIFLEAMTRLGGTPADTLHVGDAIIEDVSGARAAGLDVAWLNTKAKALKPTDPQPTYTLRQLTDVRDVLSHGSAVRPRR